jgi:hypothetical protein
MQSNWKPGVVVIVGAVASCPLVYHALQPVNFYSTKGSFIPEMLFVGVLSAFFACVLLFKPFARLCARTSAHLPKAINDTQWSLVVHGHGLALRVSKDNRSRERRTLERKARNPVYERICG